MPRVPTYGPSQVSTRPVAAPYRDAGTISPVGEGLSNIGRQIAGPAFDLLGRRRAAAREHADQIRIRDAEVALAEWELGRRENTRDGWQARRGADAVGLSDQINTELKTKVDEIRKTLVNPRQLEAFDRVVDERRLSLLQWSKKYENAELTKHDTEAHQKFIELATQNAISNHADSERVGLELSRIVAETKDWGARNGQADVVTQAEVLLATTTVHTGVIARYLATGDDRKAANYYAEVKDEISGSQRAAIEQDLEAGSTAGEAMRQTDNILNVTRTKGEALEAAKLIAGDDEKLRTAIENKIIRAYNIRDDLAREKAEQTMIELANVIDAGGDIPDNVLSRLPIRDREEIRRYEDSKRGGGSIETDMVEYIRLRTLAVTNPGAFAKENLQSKIGTINRVELKELVDIQLDLRKGNKPKAEAALDDFRTELQVINQALDAHGIARDGEDGKANAPAVARLHRLVADRVRSHQNLTGKKADNAVVQSVVDDILGQSVTTPGSWWSFLPGGAPLSDTTKRLIDYTIADVPAAAKKDIVDALKRHKRPVTDAAVLELYIDNELRKRSARR